MPVARVVPHCGSGNDLWRAHLCYSTVLLLRVATRLSCSKCWRAQSASVSASRSAAISRHRTSTSSSIELSQSVWMRVERLSSRHGRRIAHQLAGPKSSATAPARPRSRRELTRLRIAVDIDEVLGLFLTTLCDYCREEHDFRHTVDEFYVYEFAKVWGCDQATSTSLVHSFLRSPQFAEDGIPPMPGALQALRRLREQHDLHVVTSRQFAIRDETLRWIDEHFPGVFSGVHFGNHWAESGPARPKSRICREIGAHMLIDDNPEYARECAAHGIRVLLYNWRLGYPWSEQPDRLTHPNITVVSSWEDVEAHIGALDVPALHQA